MADDKEGVLFDEEEEFDPFDVDDFDIDQEYMDDDNPQDTVDYPTMRNMPEPKPREKVFSAKRTGSAREAIMSLFSHNPSIRPVMLYIINMCREGCESSKVIESVDAYQKDNFSVYSPMTLCRTLEEAGALTIVVPEVTEEKETEEGDAEYLEIKEKVDPIITSTDVAIEIADEYAEGGEFRRIIIEHEEKYREVYMAVMRLTSGESGCSINEINKLVDTFDIVKKPRRFGGHFVDQLEKTDAIIWRSRAWHITEFGARMLAQMEEGE